MKDFATAYAMKKRAKKMAHGGSSDEGPSEKANQMGVHKIVPNYDRVHSEVKHGQSEARHGDKKDKHRQIIEELRAMPKPNLPMADGGDVDEYGYPKHPKDEKPIYDVSGYGKAEGGDIVSKVMKKAKCYSAGGVVANEDEPTADMHEAEYDDLEADDHLEPHFPEDGNEHGDMAEDEDREDIVSKVLKSRRMKDRNPRPA